MIKYSFMFLIIFAALSCSKKIATDLNSDEFFYRTSVQSSDEEEYIPIRSTREIEDLDPSYFPPPVITTFEELDDWLEFNDNLVLAHFKAGNQQPFFTLDEGLMQRLVNHINANEWQAYKLIGHTNSQGNNKSNMDLSIRRARWVLEIMANKYGLRMGGTSASGEGETNPLNDNSTLEMRKANSRVELRRLK